MNYAALKDELALPEYTGTPDNKRQQYNSKMIERNRLVTLTALQEYLGPEGLLPVLDARTKDSTDVNAQAAAKEIMFLFGPYSRRDTVNVNHHRFAAGLGALLAAGDITDTQQAAIAALGAEFVHVSATKQGLPAEIRTSDVIKAEAF